MHYKNGTEAKDGDHVVMKKDWDGKIIAGVLHSTIPANESCNGQVAFPVVGGVGTECATVGNIYSAADALSAIEEKTASEKAKPENLKAP